MFLLILRYFKKIYQLYNNKMNDEIHTFVYEDCYYQNNVNLRKKKRVVHMFVIIFKI